MILLTNLEATKNEKINDTLEANNAGRNTSYTPEKSSKACLDVRIQRHKIEERLEKKQARKARRFENITLKTITHSLTGITVKRCYNI